MGRCIHTPISTIRVSLSIARKESPLGGLIGNSREPYEIVEEAPLLWPSDVHRLLFL